MKIGMKEVLTFRQWLLQTLPTSSRVGIDQYLITSRDFHDLEAFLDKRGHTLVALSNLVDVVWKNRPEPKLNELEPIGPTFSGEQLIYTKLH